MEKAHDWLMGFLGRGKGRLLLCSKIHIDPGASCVQYEYGTGRRVYDAFAAGAVGGMDGVPHATGHFRTLGTPHPRLEALARRCSHSHNELAHRHHCAVLAGRAALTAG